MLSNKHVIAYLLISILLSGITSTSLASTQNERHVAQLTSTIQNSQGLSSHCILAGLVSIRPIHPVTFQILFVCKSFFLSKGV